jgi:uncharacterized membrane protein
MAFRRLIVFSAVTVVALAAIAGIALLRLPEGSMLPVHWTVDGVPDRSMHAAGALFMPAGICALLSLLMAAIPRLDPIQRNMEQSAPLLKTAWVGMLAMMSLTELMVAAPAFGFVIPAMLPLTARGLLLVAIGNVLPKSRPGFFVGIRIPWALRDTDNWIATHRLGAWTMMLGGFAIMAIAIAPVRGLERVRFVDVAMAAAIVPPFVYSWVLWRRTQRRV